MDELPLPCTKPIVANVCPSKLFSTSKPLLLISVAVLQLSKAWLLRKIPSKFINVTSKAATVLKVAVSEY